MKLLTGTRPVKTALFVFMLVAFSSCSKVRMKYEATLVDDYFHTAQFEYSKSYSIEDKSRKCWLTAIFLGGSCWSYLTGPSEERQQQIRIDASKKLEEIFGPNNFQHKNVEIKRFGWSDLPEDYAFPSGSPLKNNYPFLHQESKSTKVPLEIPSTNSAFGEQK